MQDHPPTPAKVEGPKSDAQTPAIPKTECPTTRAQRVKSNVRKILLASPLFPRFYADVVISSAPNSNEAKILRENYSKILSQVNLNMANNSSCTHIKVTGVRCGSPTLRGEQFCYFHQRVHRGVRTPPQARLHPIALIEDEESIQMALMEVINALMRNTIDLKRATLILRALHIAVKNARRVRFNAKSDAVTEVPEFAAPDNSYADQAEAERALRIPAYNPEATKPGYVQTAAERKADPNYRPPAPPNESAEDMRAHYYGYPNAAAYAAAQAAERSKAESASVDRAPTPANPTKSKNDNSSRSLTSTTGSSQKLTTTVEERRFSAASAEKKEGALAPVGIRSQKEMSRPDKNRMNKKPSASTRVPTAQNRRKANGASAN